MSNNLEHSEPIVRPQKMLAITTITTTIITTLISSKVLKEEAVTEQ